MAIADVLAASTVRAVHVGFLDIKDDPVRGWTGPGIFAPTGTGDDDLDGETFLSSEGAVEITEFTEDQGIGGPLTITFAAGDMEDEEIFQQLIVDRRAWQGRKAKIWLFFLSEDESTVLSDFAVLFDGVMTEAQTSRQPGKPALIRITCDQDLQKARSVPVRWIDHQFFYPTDTASTFINDVARGGIATAIETSGVGGYYPNDPAREEAQLPPGHPGWLPSDER